MQVNGIHPEANGSTSAPVLAGPAFQQAQHVGNGNGSKVANAGAIVREGVPEELIALLNLPLPSEAIQPHPTKAYLSTIKTIYVIERLNQVFGLGGWKYTPEIVESDPAQKMVVMKVTVTVPKYGVEFTQYGGNDNDDRGDAYKGAITDAISKIGGYLGIGIDVYKGGGPTKAQPAGRAVAKTNATPRQQRPTAAPAPTPIRAAATTTPAPAVAPATPPAPAAPPLPLKVTTRADFFGSNRTGRRAAFVEVASILPVDTFVAALHQHGADKVEDFKTANIAWDCYERMVEAVRAQLAKQQDPTTFAHFTAQEGGIQ